MLHHSAGWAFTAILISFSNLNYEEVHTGLWKKAVRLISTRSLRLPIQRNQPAMGWQMSSHWIQSDGAVHVGCPIIVKLEQVLINGLGQSVEFSHLQHIAAQADDVTVWFHKMDSQEKGFHEGVCFSKSEERTG